MKHCSSLFSALDFEKYQFPDFPTDLPWALAGGRLSLLTAYQIFDVSDVHGSAHRMPSTAASQPISSTSLVIFFVLNHTTFVSSTVLQETHTSNSPTLFNS